MIQYHILKQLIPLNIHVLYTLCLYVQNNGLKLLLNSNFKSKMSSVVLFYFLNLIFALNFIVLKVYPILQTKNIFKKRKCLLDF